MSGQGCEWAGCSEPAVTREDGYWHCRRDLYLHRGLLSGNASKLSIDERLDQIRPLHALGHSDAEIGDAIGLTPARVAQLRQRAGLSSNRGPMQRPFKHGGTAGYKVHRSRGEEPCGPCRVAKQELDQQTQARRKQRGAA